MMSFNKYLSHPAKPGEDTAPTLLIGEAGQFNDTGHLRTVADRMVKVCQQQQLADGTPANQVAEVIGLTHDFAKLTRWAQKHLRNQPFQQSNRYRYHAFPSGLVTLYCLSQCRSEVSEYASEVATLVVTGHHNTTAPPEPTWVSNQYGQRTNAIEGKYTRIKDQFKDIDNNAPRRADNIIEVATNGEGSWSEFKEWHNRRTEPIGGVHDHLLYFAEMEDGPRRDGYYADVVRLWTALKFADHTAASGIKKGDLDGRVPDRCNLDEHVEDLDDGNGILAELNTLRNQARKDVTENIESVVRSNDVGLITLPTGFGKTYAGLSAGLKAANISNSKLVYVLPYTSILDQTANEIQSVFDVSPYSKSFTLHHHLSDTYTGLGNRYTDADIGRSPGTLHAESWLSGLTLTTTVQLFESLAAPTARQATRVPSLQDAAVVIDEPQAIPEKWWQIVPRLVELLVETYDATVILMTATQPGIVEYGSDVLNTQELTNNTEQYTEFLANHPRVTYNLHDTIRATLSEDTATLDYDAAGTLVSEAAGNANDVLAVCNTRASAEELYQCTIATEKREDTVELGQLLHEHTVETGELPTPSQLRERALDVASRTDAETVYTFLSGNVRPDDRAVIIDALYDDDAGDADAPAPLLNCELSVVLVSTSVVEAGVDISFDTVFRDYAPIPNIVQSGGRCNRSFGGETGDVVVWRLAEPEDGSRIPSLVIHGGDGGDALPLLQETGRVLQRHSTSDGRIEESTMVSDTVSDFYESLFNRPLNPGEERLAQAVDTVSMSELAGEHMIEEIENYEDVVACLTDSERDNLLGEIESYSDVLEYPGAQINTNPSSWAREITNGHSSYLVLDARNSGYHPVFGVRSG